jgi:hypothetical protein
LQAQASIIEEAEGAAAFWSQARQLATEGEVVSGLNVFSGHETHADWFASSL